MACWVSLARSCFGLRLGCKGLVADKFYFLEKTNTCIGQGLYT